MIRSALRRMVSEDEPNWIMRMTPDVFWRWLFDIGEIDALVQSARLKLVTSTTITVYEFVDGREINRRDANPLAGLQRAIPRITDAFAKMAADVQVQFAAAIDQGKIRHL